MLLLAEVDSKSVIVAVAIIALVLIIMVAAIIRYQAEDVLKIWAALGTLVGLVAGTMGTYFFTREVNTQERAALTAEKSAIAADKQVAVAETRSAEAAKVAYQNAAKFADMERARAIELFAKVQTGKPTLVFGPSETGVISYSSGTMSDEEKLKIKEFYEKFLFKDRGGVAEKAPDKKELKTP